MKLCDLIEGLEAMVEKFGPDREILIRRGHANGYYSDHEIQIGVFYPDNGIRLMPGELPSEDQTQMPCLRSE